LGYTLGLGGLAVMTAGLTTLTGALLMFYYEPTLAGAYPSLVFIDSVVYWGRFIRALHYWSAQVMVVAVIGHTARIVFTGGYRPPREVNWFIGLGLLLVTLLWNFSGYKSAESLTWPGRQAIPAVGGRSKYRFGHHPSVLYLARYGANPARFGGDWLPPMAGAGGWRPLPARLDGRQAAPVGRPRSHPV
jgi:hypothetical protein